MNKKNHEAPGERSALPEDDTPQPTEEPLSEPSGSPPVIIRLHRVRAVATALGDALQTDGRDFSEHLSERALVCDLLSDEVAAITIELAREGKL